MRLSLILLAMPFAFGLGYFGVHGGSGGPFGLGIFGGLLLAIIFISVFLFVKDNPG